MKKSFAIFLIVLAVAGSYAPAIRDGFVWDDTALILRDPLIRSWRLIPEGFNHFLFADATASDFYRPIQRLTYALEYGAFGFNPAPYHVTSILLHAAAAVALFFLAEELLLAFGLQDPRRGWLALIATLIWAVHPVHTSAVVYISGRADPLAAVFGFLGCYFALRAFREKGPQPVLWLCAAGFAFLIGTFSKETGLIFPVLAVAVFALLRRGKAVLQLTVVTAFVAVIYFSLRLAAIHHPAPVTHTPPPLSVRPISMARAVAEYAGLMVFPLNLHMERQIDVQRGDHVDATMKQSAGRELQTLLGIILIAGVVYWSVRMRQREPVVFALLILTAISYLPVSGIFVLNAAVAEHWIYLPSAFLFLAATITCARLFDVARTSRLVWQTASVGLACWMGFLCVRTGLRTLDWKDQRTFLQRTMAAGGDSARMLINMGGLELSEGHLDVAKTYLQSALQKEPDQPMAVINLAVVALRQKDFKTSRELALRATQMEMVDAQAHELLAVLEHKEKGRIDLMRLRLASRTGPPNWAIEKRYVQLIDETGATTTAIRELQTCLQTEWYRAESWEMLAQLLHKIGKPSEAAIAQRQADAYDVHLGGNAKFL